MELQPRKALSMYITRIMQNTAIVLISSALIGPMAASCSVKYCLVTGAPPACSGCFLRSRLYFQSISAMTRTQKISTGQQ